MSFVFLSSGVCMNTRIHLEHICDNTDSNKVRHNGTLHNWPAVECRPPDRPLARPPAHRQRYRRRQTTDADRRKRAEQYWPIRRASNKMRPIFLTDPMC